MADAPFAQAERLAQAKAAQTARENGIRAQAIQQGRKLERDELTQAAGVATLEEISLLAQVRQEHAAELTRLNETHAQAAKRAFGHGFWRGGTIVGLVTAGAFVTIMAVYSQYVINTTFDASRDMQTQSAITGQIAAERAQRP